MKQKQQTERQEAAQGRLRLPDSLPADYSPTGPEGLTEAEAKRRAEGGQRNRMSAQGGKSVSQIILGNVFTLFNILNVALALCLLLVGSYRNMLFLVIVLANTGIAIFQELRAKKTIEQMRLLNMAEVCVLREGKERTCSPEDTVAGDLVVLRAGDQVMADAVVVSGRGSAMESLLTGESDAVLKEQGSWLYSGSYVTEGRMTVQQIYVGDESYAGRLTAETRRARKPESGLMREEQRLIRLDSMLLIPLGLLLFAKSYFLEQQALQTVIPSTVAAMIGMIPEGLILLTSIAMATGVVRLAKQHVLVQELYGIESLARVDVLCLDKTGTITSGRMRVEELRPVTAQQEDARDSLRRFLNVFDERSGTLEALRGYFGEAGPTRAAEDPAVTGILPFSSERKKSAASFADGCTLILGAPEYVLGRETLESGTLLRDTDRSWIREETRSGRRVIVLARGDGEIREESLPPVARVLALFTIADELRPHAADTIRYFRQQGVDIRVISGDNPGTVSRIAQQAGIGGWDRAVDMGTLHTQEEIEEACERYTIFGRVTPAQKKMIITALRRKGHTVGMTGDGVNDIPAMKEADCSIAMAEGTDATRHAAQLTLLESDFGVVPGIVLEGRRVINNITRSASLFLTKTIFSMLLSLLTLILPGSYPFQPIHMSLVSSMTVGLPGAVLALENNRERIRGKFLHTVIMRALPGGLAIAVCATLAMQLARFDFTPEVCSTVATWIAGLVSVLVLVRTCMPLNRLRAIVAALSLCSFVTLAIFMGHVFLLERLDARGWAALGILVALAVVIFLGSAFLIKKQLRFRDAVNAAERTEKV